MSKSELENKSQRDYSGAWRSPSEQAAFMDGMMHLLEMATRFHDSHQFRTYYEMAGSKEMLNFMKSYCGRE